MSPLPLRPTTQRSLSSWDGHGTDLLVDSLAHNEGFAPKLILHGHSSTGFDVSNLLQNLAGSKSPLASSGGKVHMAGSIIALPSACFLWKNVQTPEDITPSALAWVPLQSPKLEYLFLGSKQPILPDQVKILRESLAMEEDLVIESMDVVRCHGFPLCRLSRRNIVIYPAFKVQYVQVS